MIRHIAFGLLAAVALAAASTGLMAQTPAPATAAPPVSQRFGGYVPLNDLPNIAALVPPPPAKGTATKKADDAIYKATRKFKGNARWNQAAADVPLVMPKAADDIFACALGVPIDPEASPALTRLLRRSYADAGLAVNAAKDVFKRPRPFTQFKKTETCQPQTDALAANFSYPSGHAAVGWAMGLALAEAAPDRRDAILQRARSFGDSRVVCGVHWNSDVIAGRDAAAATIAAGHANPEFAADIAAARAEIAAARAKGLKPTQDCAKQTAGLATPLPR